MTALERVRARLPTTAIEKVEAALLDAEETILNYTGRSELPERLIGVQAKLAIISINQEGAEGENSHSEGGVSRTMDALPEDVLKQLRPWRVAKVVNMHEAP